MGIDTTIRIKLQQKIEDDVLRKLNYRFMEATNIHYGVAPIFLSKYNSFVDGFCYEIDTLERYYGIGYERGNWPNILMALKWLKYNLPQDVVLYYMGDGDDSNYEFTKEIESELTEHWLIHGGIPYRHRENKFNKKCPTCNELMSQYMWSGDNGGVICLGCKYKIETRDSGITWTELSSPTR